ncbi:hypothetical protein AAVH_36482 [Aphelenchoides avenae]|nr:hypothetical protein AAVH_36482 [Aphelenchus avenae]
MLQPTSSQSSRSRSPPRPRHSHQERVQHAIERTRQTAVTAAQEVAQQAALINAEVLKSLVDRLEHIDAKLSAIDSALQMLTEKIDQCGGNMDEQERAQHD